MATTALIPDNQDVYRGMRNRNWVKHGAVRYRAFMLRPATDQFAAETELSLGLSVESAVDELVEHHGAARLSVMAVHALPHSLTVRSDPRNAAKAEMFGLPLFSRDPTLRDLAVTIATDLAELANFVHPNQ